MCPLWNLATGFPFPRLTAGLTSWSYLPGRVTSSEAHHLSTSHVLAGEMGLISAWLDPEICCEGHRGLVTIVLQKHISPGHSCRVLCDNGIGMGQQPHMGTWSLLPFPPHLFINPQAEAVFLFWLCCGAAVHPKRPRWPISAAPGALLSCPPPCLPAHSFHKAQWLLPAGSPQR